ncbi:MAG: PEGA domain-containing protein [Candidatus Shapirobacteria bacterium]|nr:PEGA domain-containing protein [Candidatus Shapirobacteria bacterium]
MKKFILPISTIILITAVGYFFRYSLFASQGVLEINTNPPTIVVLNDEPMGITPFKKELKPQRLEIKLLAENNQENILWQGKLPITPSAITLVKYDFGDNEQDNYGEILTFSKTSDNKNGSLLVSSWPDRAVVNLDGETKGYTPILLEKIPPGHHSLELNLAGYNNMVAGVNIVAGFQLNAEIKLAKSEETDNDQEKTDQPSLNEEGMMVTVLSTPTGWLRARSGPGTGFEEVAKVNPGEKYLLLEKNDEWLKIALEDESEGWISAQYGKIED